MQLDQFCIIMCMTLQVVLLLQVYEFVFVTIYNLSAHSSISPKPERKIKPLCTTKITNSTTPVGTVQPTTRTIQPPKCTPSTSKQVLPLPSQSQILETKYDKRRLHQITTTTNSTSTAITSAKESKKLSSVANNKKQKKQVKFWGRMV